MNSTDPNRSGRQTDLSAALAVRLEAKAAKVLMLKNTVPGNWVAAAIQLRSCGCQPRQCAGAGRCWPIASTPVVAGLCACTSWQKEAEVKKIDPTK